ncbi:MAG: hypothetical protein AAF623_20810 [Planctomycetota bacterium]
MNRSEFERRPGRVLFKIGDRRAGFSMIEMLVFLWAGALLLLVSVSWLHTILGQATKSRLNQRQNRRLVQLSFQIRQDFRAAGEMRFVDASNELTLVGDGETIQYKISSDSRKLQRETYASLIGKPQANEKLTPASNNLFHVENGFEFRWDDSEMPEWMSLTVVFVPPVSVKQSQPETRAVFRVRSGPLKITGKSPRRSPGRLNSVEAEPGNQGKDTPDSDANDNSVQEVKK